MATHAQQSRPEWQPIHQPEKHLQTNNDVDQLRKKLLRDNSVLFHELGEIVQARRDGHGEEAEANDSSYVADERENPHVDEVSRSLFGVNC